MGKTIQGYTKLMN